MEQYIHSLGLLLEDVSIDTTGRLFILIDGVDTEGKSAYKQIEIPEEYQTFENIELIRQQKKCIGCDDPNPTKCDNKMCHSCWLRETDDGRSELNEE